MPMKDSSPETRICFSGGAGALRGHAGRRQIFVQQGKSFTSLPPAGREPSPKKTSQPSLVHALEVGHCLLHYRTARPQPLSEPQVDCLPSCRERSRSS